MKGYCMKCKTKRDMKNVKKMHKNKKYYMTGSCTKCGTKMAVFTK